VQPLCPGETRATNQQYFEVYSDIEDLRSHYRKSHHVCTKSYECRDLAFQDGASLAKHYLDVHNQQVPVQLNF
jgi:hypothetical protein